MLDIRLEGKAPIYEQVYGGIAQLISSGRLKPEERLPAVREVAKHLGINPNTVQKAYAQLEQAGLIYSIPAKGSYVAAEDNAAAALREESLKRLHTEMISAHKIGVIYGDVIELVNEIWTDDGRGGNL